MVPLRVLSLLVNQRRGPFTPPTVWRCRGSDRFSGRGLSSSVCCKQATVANANQAKLTSCEPASSPLLLSQARSGLLPLAGWSPGSTTSGAESAGVRSR